MRIHFIQYRRASIFYGIVIHVDVKKCNSFTLCYTVTSIFYVFLQAFPNEKFNVIYFSFQKTKMRIFKRRCSDPNPQLESLSTLSEIDGNLTTTSRVPSSENFIEAKKSSIVLI